MQIICAFDSYKGCMTATEACHAAAVGLRERHPEAVVLCLPMSDDGDSRPLDILLQKPVAIENLRRCAGIIEEV